MKVAREQSFALCATCYGTSLIYINARKNVLAVKLIESRRDVHRLHDDCRTIDGNVCVAS